jgi:hypothetical protein
MIKKSCIYLGVALGVFAFASCNKSAGKGGSSAITGNVHVKEYNGLGTLVGESDVADHDVYIVYGIEDSIFDDKASTGFDGKYQFQYLAKGKYTLYTYSDCWTCESGDSAVFVDVEINENRTEFDAPQLNILKL